MTALLTFFFVALGVSFLCSLLESIILSVTHAHLGVLRKEGKRSGQILEQMKENISRPLAAILALNTISHTVGAVGVGAQTLQVYGNQWVAAASVILTLSILIFSEIIPKTIGAVYWKHLAGFAAYTLKGLIVAMYPFVGLSEFMSRFIGRGGQNQRVTREEMIIMAEMGEEEGTLEEHESDIIENLMKLNDVFAEDVMTPRSVVFALQKDATVEKVMKEHSPIAFSRIPIFDKNLDDVIGFIHRYDLVNKQAEDQFHISMKDLMEPVHTVSEKDSVASILDDFVKRRQQIFLVIDEFGSTQGIITLEDAIETLLGVEIVDEHDSVVDMRKLARDMWKHRRESRPAADK